MKVSLITITYNSEKTIEKTIKSVISQKYKNIEYIIIDGGSQDKTLDIVSRYKEKISVIVSEPDNGISDAFNKGINYSTGEIIGIINSDDYLNKDAISILVKNIKEYPDNDIYFGNAIFFDDKINYICKPDKNLEKIKLKFLLYHPSIFVRKKAYLKYGIFDINFKCAMDFELISRMYFQGAKFKYIDYEFSWFRRGGTSQTNFYQTIDECKKIATRNGCDLKEINNWYKKITKKNKKIELLKKIGLEPLFRNILKKQKKDLKNDNWFD